MKLSYCAVTLAALAVPARTHPAYLDPDNLQKRQLFGGKAATFDSIRSQAEEIAIKAAQDAVKGSPEGIISADAIRSRRGSISSIENPSGINSVNNKNPDPPTPIFPQVLAQDAPYSLSEETLRGAIFIPPTFQFAGQNGSGIGSPQKQPVILVPGTAVMAGDTYKDNLVPLLTNSDFADPLWVNIPEASLDDAQVNSEFVAYAMNYVSSLTGQKATIVAWSQGNLNTQWALKYWPSTRDTVTDFVSYSPDFKGTALAGLACNVLTNLLTCTPAIRQQKTGSDFVETLRSDGGDSAFVPTTSIFSATDEIVQPQSGLRASGIINDSRNVGVENVEVQTVCPGTPAGTIVTHEGMLYNSLAFALLEDAMRNEGPGRVSRIDRAVCAEAGAKELGAVEIVQTEAVLVDAALNVLTFPEKVFREPRIEAYA